MPSDCKFEFVSLNTHVLSNYISLFLFVVVSICAIHNSIHFTIDTPVSIKPIPHSRTFISTHLSQRCAFPKTTKKVSNSSPKQQHPNRPVDAVRNKTVARIKPNPFQQKQAHVPQPKASIALHHTLRPRQCSMCFTARQYTPPPAITIELSAFTAKRTT